MLAKSRNILIIFETPPPPHQILNPLDLDLKFHSHQAAASVLTLRERFAVFQWEYSDRLTLILTLIRQNHDTFPVDWCQYTETDNTMDLLRIGTCIHNTKNSLPAFFSFSKNTKRSNLLCFSFSSSAALASSLLTRSMLSLFLTCQLFFGRIFMFVGFVL